MKKILLLILCCLPLFLLAQRSTGNLTIFSEDGDKFFLVLNGEKQNDIAQTNIRIDELPQPYYSVKIIFADSTINMISKNVQISDFDNNMMDVTYRIRKDKSRKAKLNPYSSIAAQPDFIAPAGMYVRHFGQNDGANNSTMTTTTTTSNTVGASIAAPGVNMNITINDPAEKHTSTSTTTTTSSHSSSSNSNITHNPHTNCNGWPMNSSDYAAAKKTISETSFEESKLTTAKSIASANCLSSDQIVAICNLFSFEDSKLSFAKYAYKYTTDPKNYFKVNNVFSFDASKEDLSKYVSGE